MKIKERFKYVVIGMVIMAMFDMVVPVMAAMVQKQISVSTGVNIYVDDVKLNPVDANGKLIEAFIYNGTTYLPVRAVANAVGKPVVWDGKTSSVYLGKHDSSEPAVMLHDLDYFNSSNDFNGLKVNKNVKDNLGNTYNYGLNSGSANNRWVEYKINGLYSRMKGKVALSYSGRATKSESYFKVYGDGKLIYSSKVITGGVDPIGFDIDLTGVLTLKVELEGSGYQLYIVDTGLYQ